MVLWLSCGCVLYDVAKLGIIIETSKCLVQKEKRAPPRIGGARVIVGFL
jgi:hypothetical protein